MLAPWRLQLPPAALPSARLQEEGACPWALSQRPSRLAFTPSGLDYVKGYLSTRVGGKCIAWADHDAPPVPKSNLGSDLEKSNAYVFLRQSVASATVSESPTEKRPQNRAVLATFTRLNPFKAKYSAITKSYYNLLASRSERQIADKPRANAHLPIGST